MARLLIGSANPGKVKTFQRLLQEFGFETVIPTDLGITDAPEETGETFAENSLLKANYYWQQAQIPVLTDDGGLEIDALGGAPGVHSRRIDGIEQTDDELRRIILEKVASIPDAQRTARLTTVLTLRVNKDVDFQAQASLDGMIRPSDIPADPGMPYRGILWIPKYQKFYAEFTAEELAAADHRKEAVKKLLPYLNEFVL